MSLIDPRVTKQAKVLVDYSIKVKRGDKVMIVADFEAKPLVAEIYKLCILRGASEIRFHFDSYDLAEIYYKNASKAQIKSFPKISMDEIKQIDCWIRIWSPSNPRGLTGIDASLISERRKTIRPITNWRVEKTRWVVTNFPTEALAQEADMSLSDYENFLFKVINSMDWKKLFKQQEKLRKLIDKTKKVQIKGPGTDLVLSIAGRKAVNSAGKNNMPSGEVFTSVVENSANGFISYTYPALYFGREFHDVYLEFKNGKVVKAEASKGEKDLNKILDMDHGARFIGELGFGNNNKIKRFTKDILFDEKIGGTVHIALGKGYKETLTRNKSTLHWDMIKDLRQGGELWFDGKLVQKNGKWLIKL